MGTSSNQRSSSKVPSWRIVQSVLGNNNIAEEMQSTELWRAAIGDRNGALEKELTSAEIAGAAWIAASADKATSAAQTYDDSLDANQQSGIVCDIARLALLRAVNDKRGATGFARELFVETIDYYVSRDLPSYVGSEGRVGSSSEAIALKDRIREATRAVVAPIALDISRGDRKVDSARWKRYVRSVLLSLRKGQRK